MQPASAGTVLGDFNDATLAWKGVVTTFHRPDGGFAVRTEAADGGPEAFPVRFTLGIEPLQRYLVESPRGRLQSPDIAWDSRPVAAGGQRWLHLPAAELHRGADEALGGPSPRHGWNQPCGACHTTDFHKNYRPEGDNFETAFAEGDVGCEACHGPASGHVAWAKGGKPSSEAQKGLTFSLRGASLASWGNAGTTGTLGRTGPISRVEVDTCGTCHSRRRQLWPTAQPGAPIGQAYRVSLLEEGLYAPDGQMLGEVYEYGSFLQSSMFQQGVTCSDCHEPHSAGKLQSAGNAVCTRCHLAARFEAKEHHHHAPGSEAAQCVGCHMVERTYMAVDARRDHSFRIPRPDLALKLGTPDACTGCHKDRGVRWSAEKALALWGKALAARPEWGEAIAAGRGWQPAAGDRLADAALNTAFPAIARATAVELLERFPGPQFATLLEGWAKDRDPLVRRATAHALAGLEPPARARLTLPMLADPVRDVRLEATMTLETVPQRLLDAPARAALKVATGELRTSLAADADRSDAQYDLGMLELALGNAREAEAAFRLAIARGPGFAPSYLQLAEVLRGTGRESEAERTLRDAVQRDATDAPAYHALGMTFLRRGRKAEALPLLEKAARLGAADPHFAYVYAVTLEDTGNHRGARAVLEKTQARFPGDLEVLTRLVLLARDAGDRESTRRWAQKLSAAAPNVTAVQQFIHSVEAGNR
jgi:predicted CXXCH cytochrome family protein